MAAVEFAVDYSQCFWKVHDYGTESNILRSVRYCAIYAVPAVAVAVSCIISAVILTRRNRNVQQRELQQSRNRATVTILLFGLLHGVCNAPLLVYYTMWAFYSLKDKKCFSKLYKFDTHLYYENAIFSLLPAANSAANPILYFWRMKPLREYAMTRTRKILRLKRIQVKRPAAINSK